MCLLVQLFVFEQKIPSHSFMNGISMNVMTKNSVFVKTFLHVTEFTMTEGRF